MTKLSIPLFIAAAALSLSACGHGVEQRAASGALAGAVAGGPPGAIMGARVGTAVSQVFDRKQR